MTVETLDAYEADELDAAVSLAMLDEVAEHGRLQGRGEALADVEDTIVESLDEIEARVEAIVAEGIQTIEDTINWNGELIEVAIKETLQEVGQWVADLHISMGRLTADVVRAVGLIEAEPDVDVYDLVALEADLDDVRGAEDHLGKALNELAQAMFLLGEAPDGRAVASEADDNIEYGYWSLMKARSDVASWLHEVEAERQEVLS